MWKSLLLLVVVALPDIALAAGLVPCGGPGEPQCESCHVAILMVTVTEWLVAIMGIVAVLLIIYAGLRMVVSVGDVSAKQDAKTRISNVLVGYAILLAGWMLVDTVVKFMVTDQVYGVWNEIQCGVQPVLSSSGFTWLSVLL